MFQSNEGESSPITQEARATPVCRRGHSVDGLATTDLQFLAGRAEIMPKGQLLESEGWPQKEIYVVKDGWAMRHKDLPDGRRQVLDFVLPGDLVGVEAGALQRADHTVTALTDIVVSRFPFQRIEDLIREHPRVATALLWIAARQRAVVAEHLVDVGRRSGVERIAHLVVELWLRLKTRGLAAEHTFRMPVTQDTLADALGLSVVHVYRCLRELARAGLVEKNREMVTIRDLPGLLEVAGFEAAYLTDVLPMSDEMAEAFARLGAKPT